MAAKLRILVVDDEESIRDLLAIGLGHRGFEVKTASDAQEALEQIGVFSPHAAIVDVMMPGDDGFQLARRLRQDPNLYILMLTARDAVSDRVQGLDDGADDYLIKPFDFDELVARINAGLRRIQTNETRVWEFQEIRMDDVSHRVTAQGKMETVDYAAANQSYSELRGLKTEEVFCLNGTKLHEWYFDNLGGQGGQATGRILELINRDFGSYQKFETEFKATGLAVRGWVVLAYDLDDQKLHIYGQDAHNVGVPWGAYPLLILDVYEHAYGIDYGVKRAPYLDAFMKNVDWNETNARLAKYHI